MADLADSPPSQEKSSNHVDVRYGNSNSGIWNGVCMNPCLSMLLKPYKKTHRPHKTLHKTPCNRLSEKLGDLKAYKTKLGDLKPYRTPKPSTLNHLRRIRLTASFQQYNIFKEGSGRGWRGGWGGGASSTGFDKVRKRASGVLGVKALGVQVGLLQGL